MPNGNALSSSFVGISNPGENVRPLVNKTTLLSGSDYLGKVTVTPTTGTGRIIKTFPISPSEYPGTRLTQLSNLWEFFRFRKFHVRWVPAVPTTLACQFVLYVDLDPSDDPTIILDEEALIRQAVAQTGAQQWNFHVPKTIPMAMRADRQMYFTGSTKSNPRFSQQGKGYLIQITNPINFNGENIVDTLDAGSLFIDWTVCFGTAQINPSAVAPRSGCTIGSFLPLFDITPLPSVGNNLLTIGGLVPGETYLISYAFNGACTTTDYIEGYVGPDDTSLKFYSHKIGSAGDFRIDVPPSEPVTSGFYPVVADANGETGEMLLVVPSGVTVSGAFISLFAIRSDGEITGLARANCRRTYTQTDIEEAIRYLRSLEALDEKREAKPLPAVPYFGEGTKQAGDGWPSADTNKTL